METKTIYAQVLYMQDNLVSFSTGGIWNSEEYSYGDLRKVLLENKAIVKHLPEFILSKRELDQFWQFIKRKFSHYSERREYLWESFGPLLSILESNEKGIGISPDFASFGFEYVKQEWQKCTERLASDPEAAITSARTLLETTCKHILDELGEPHSTEDLPKLYDKVASKLQLSPEQHHQEIFRQILGGCKSVVCGMGALRNKLSDSHGKGKTQIVPKLRHAELAVNLAGTVSTFLLKTYTETKVIC